MTTNTATESQTQYIATLIQRRAIDDDAQAIVDDARQAWRDGEFTKEGASRMIDVLVTLPRVVAPPAADDVPEGMHIVHLDDDDGGDQIYKVQRAVHGSGHTYAKRLVAQTYRDPDTGEVETDVRFEYAPGATRSLSPDTLLSLEEAREFGAVYGNCVVCGRTLTDEDSIAAGIGPVCAKRFA